MNKPLAIVCMLLTGCAAQVPQRVEGRVTVDGEPVEATTVRLASGDNYSTCLKEATEVNVRDGAFLLDRQVKVESQRDGLCIRDGSMWVLAWRNSYKNPPKTLSFACDKHQERWTCQANGLESQH